MMDYKSLLKEGYKNLPEIEKGVERFEIPKVAGHIEGNKTIVTNFKAIANTLRRDDFHLLKYLQRELATPGQMQDNRLVLNRKISSSRINEKIEQYTKEFVLCPECRKPDTILKKENNVTTIKCQACGTKKPIRTRI